MIVVVFNIALWCIGGFVLLSICLDGSRMDMRSHRRKGHEIAEPEVSASVAFATGFYTYRCSCGEEWTL